MRPRPTSSPRPPSRAASRPAHAIVLDAELERADENEADHPGIRDEQITLANAAARHVAAELGCTDTGLVGGVPEKVT